MAVQCVPDDQQAVAEQPEHDGPLDGLADPVAGLPDTEDVLHVEEHDLDAPPGRVAGDDLLGGGGEVGGDQREVVAAAARAPGVAQQDDADGVGAPGAVPQAGALGDLHRGGGAVTGDRHGLPRRGAGDVGGGG